MWDDLLKRIKADDKKALARAISLIENEHENYFDFLQSLENINTPVIGITGPPGAGKSTLTDVLIEVLINDDKKIGVLCIDPSSPFSSGALLGDRIRMNRWFNNENVFIRSLASRGNVGGVNPKIIEVISVMQAARFDYIIIETVGAGQNEVEIAGIADITVVVLIPDSGDEIQTLKSGLMEIADIFVVNKSDRPGADIFIKSLRNTLSVYNSLVPVIQTTATAKQGIDELSSAIKNELLTMSKQKQSSLLAQKAFYLIKEMRMKDVSVEQLENEIKKFSKKDNFNFYAIVNKYVK